MLSFNKYLFKPTPYRLGDVQLIKQIWLLYFQNFESSRIYTQFIGNHNIQLWITYLLFPGLILLSIINNNIKY